jgi:hypothetical protein
MRTILKHYPHKEYYSNGKISYKLSKINDKDFLCEFYSNNGNISNKWKTKGKLTHGIHYNWNYYGELEQLQQFKLDTSHGTKIRFNYEK